MKLVYAVVICLLTSFSVAEESVVLNDKEIKDKIVEITDLANKMMRKGSTTEDVDKWFSNFTEDFVYVHEAYGGTYSREQLYKNAISYAEKGHYNMTSDRYEIVEILPGYNGAAVQRKNLSDGKLHLTVFEFRGDKVSKAIEYWK